MSFTLSFLVSEPLWAEESLKEIIFFTLFLSLSLSLFSVSLVTLHVKGPEDLLCSVTL